MITEIHLHGAGSYSDDSRMDPTAINYVFGGNGVGKTILGKVIDGADEFPNAAVNWGNTEYEVLVYNKQFIKDNFSQSDTIKGVFTLGKDAVEVQKALDELAKERLRTTTKLEGARKVYREQEIRKIEIEKDFTEKCWGQKTQLIDHFRKAFDGHIGKRVLFKDKCLIEKENGADLLPLEVLKEKADTLFKEKGTKLGVIQKLDMSGLATNEQNDLLGKPIVGNKDLPIGKLIDKLGNSDWVKQGLEQVPDAEGKCPMCQQMLKDELSEEIRSFFDESYENDRTALRTFDSSYRTYVQQLLDQIEAVTTREDDLEYALLYGHLQLAQATFENNKQKLDNKLSAPSQVIELTSLQGVLEDCRKEIDSLIAKVTEQHTMLDNFDQQQAVLKSLVWRYVVEQLKLDLEQFDRNAGKLDRALTAITANEKKHKEQISELDKKIRELESQATSDQHTINEINKILGLFNFQGFKLKPAAQEGFYCIVRSDGTPVRKTLSEGEFRFVTFLYFYHLIKGSQDEARENLERVIVFDDPISSLDSGLLFVVSNLVREVIHDQKKGNAGIQQVFVLTHNLYFHKEVTFYRSGTHPTGEESFWTIKKLNSVSTIQRHERNPVQGSYELLWSEISDPSAVNPATLFNTLRRILENYFKIIGRVNYEAVINRFNGEEQIVCTALLSCINDGSHFINDDVMLTTDSTDVETYLRIFELVFDCSGHYAHFNMMAERFNMSWPRGQQATEPELSPTEQLIEDAALATRPVATA